MTLKRFFHIIRALAFLRDATQKRSCANGNAFVKKGTKDYVIFLVILKIKNDGLGGKYFYIYAIFFNIYLI
jgi:hypothetical protein